MGVWMRMTSLLFSVGERGFAVQLRSHVADQTFPPGVTMTAVCHRSSSHEIASMLSVMDRRRWTWIIIFFHWISYQAGQGCYNEAPLAVLPHPTVCSKATTCRSKPLEFHLARGCFFCVGPLATTIDHQLSSFWSLNRTRSNSIVFLIVWNRNARIEKLKSTRTHQKQVQYCK